MPIFEQGYRPYVGEVRRGSRALAIAWESFRPRMRWWVWLMLAFLLLFSPYLLYGAFTFVVLSLGVGTATPGPIATEVFSGGGDPGRFVSAVLQSSGSFFWEALNDGFAMSSPVVFCAVACAGLLAADRRTGALQIYLARPVTRRDYLFGKLLASFAFCSLLTFVPSVLLWVECAALHSSFDYLKGTWWVPLSCLGASVLYAFWVSALVLFLSSVMQRPVLIGTIAIFGYFFLLGMGAVLAHATGHKEWRVIAPHYAIGGVTAPLFGRTLPEWLPLPLCAALAVGLPAVCLLVVVRRLRAVEVVT